MRINKKETAIVPTNDYVFKRIFGHVGNEDITKDFVSSVIGRKISTIDLERSTILEKNLKSDKIGILDMKTMIDKEILCNIEIQVANEKDIEKRLLYYWSKLYSRSINKGEKYGKLKKTISILITKFELKKFKEFKKYHTEWKIREKTYQNTVLTDDLELHIIELPKEEKVLKSSETEYDEELVVWLKFLLRPDDLEEEEMQKYEEIAKAKKELDYLRSSEYEERIAELREKAIRDENARYDLRL